MSVSRYEQGEAMLYLLLLLLSLSHIIYAIESTKLLIAIPTYNEAKNIAPLCAEILTSNPDADILIIDDNSPDETGKICRKGGFFRSTPAISWSISLENSR